MQALKDLPTEVPDEVIDIARSLVAQFSTVVAPIQEQLRQLSREHAPSVESTYNRWLFAHRNVHAKSLPLMDPFDVFMIASIYLLTLLAVYPIMKVLPNPKDTIVMKLFQIGHNLFLTVLSFYMVFEIVRQAVINGYGVWLNNLDDSAAGWPMAKILWVFYISKIYEFLDTILMMIRKSFRQVTFLHVYHHCTIFPIWWVVCYMGPTGDSYFSAALNSFVHVVMYSYYLLATFNISVPWKSYITVFQMAQFAANFCQAAALLYVAMPGYPLLLAQILFVYMITLLALFYNFYRKMTRAQKEKAAAKKKAQSKKEE